MISKIYSLLLKLVTTRKAITKVALWLLFNQQANSTPVDIIPDQNNFETGLGIIWSYKKSSKRHPKLHINKETELTIRIQPRIPFQSFECNVFSRDFQIVIMFITFLKILKLKLHIIITLMVALWPLFHENLSQRFIFQEI